MPNPVCTTTHSGPPVQGPGLCCAQVQSGALAPTIGSHVQVTVNTKAGPRCGTCRVVASTSRKPSHAGKPRLLFTFGGPGCPSTNRGCCALIAAGGV